MKTKTQTRGSGMPPVGTDVTVTAQDGYTATGTLIGLIRDSGRPMIRVKCADGLERRVPAPATVIPA